MNNDLFYWLRSSIAFLVYKVVSLVSKKWYTIVYINFIFPADLEKTHLRAGLKADFSMAKDLYGLLLHMKNVVGDITLLQQHLLKAKNIKL